MFLSLNFSSITTPLYYVPEFEKKCNLQFPEKAVVGLGGTVPSRSQSLPWNLSFLNLRLVFGGVGEWTSRHCKQNRNRTPASRIRGNHREHGGHGEVTEKERKKRPANVLF
ncbi:MAG: hypothetical protein D6679_12495 [Candidatus Hydrogenedentota bacterium]|nr:MAG: hypothetical protein D6679_12495 [Candidatus Hydrogenedentota bacterium]